MNSTLGLLVLGLILCVFTMVKYAMMPSQLHSDLNNGVSNDIVGDQSGEGGTDGSPESIEKKKKKSRQAKAQELFDEAGRYIIEDYDALPTFSNFLPGVAGIYGKPVSLYSFQHFLFHRKLAQY